MKVVILEDEIHAARHLQRLISKVAPEMNVAAIIETIRDAVDYFIQNKDVAILFSDIQLADGLSFSVFEQVEIKCPVIFTTAYDTYAVEAFKTNGIDYLLKPIDEDRLLQAINKIKLLTPAYSQERILNLSKTLDTKNFKTRFMVRIADKIKSIPVEDILAFYSLGKATYVHTTTNRDYAVDYSVDQLETLLDPKDCFRINRKYIISIKACNTILSWSNSRLKIKIEGIDDDDIIVARERVAAFKEWLDR